MDLLDPRGDPGGPELEEVVLPLDHRLLAEPEEADAQPGGDLGTRLVLQRRQLAAGDVDLLLEGEADGPACLGAGLHRAVEGLDALDPALLARGVEDHRVADVDGAGIDRPGDDAPVVALLGELVDVLNRHAERPLHRRRLAAEGVERVEHGRALIPGQVGRAVGDVVPATSGHRNEAGRPNADLFEEGAVLAHDTIEDRAVPADEVHLVHDHGELPDAEQRHHVAMAPGVLLHAFRGVDHEQGGFGAGGAGDHVLQELDVAGRVEDEVCRVCGS